MGLTLGGGRILQDTPGHVDLDVLTRSRPTGHPIRQGQEVVGTVRVGAGRGRCGLSSSFHSVVPPMVTPVIRSVAWPHPTGTPWPSLPQVPGVMAKSVATASTRFRISGPFPMRLASRSGSVIRPPSIRYASVVPNTKSPVVVLT